MTSPGLRRQVVAALVAVCLGLGLLAPDPSLAASAKPDRDLYVEAQQVLATLQKSPRRQAKPAEWEAAIMRFRRVVARFPQSSYSDDALFQVGALYRAMARRFDRTRYSDDAVNAFRMLVAAYPESKKGADALFAIYEMAREGSDKRKADAAGRAYLDAYPHAQHAALVKTQLTAARRASSPRAPEPVLPREPPPGLVPVYNLRFWSGETSTRVVIDIEKKVDLKYDRIHNPDRLWVDLVGSRLHPNLAGRSFPVGDGLLEQVRVAQNRDDAVRVVLDFKEVKEHTVFWLENPLRLVIDVRAPERPATETLVARSMPAPLPVPSRAAPASPSPSPRPTPTPTPVSTPRVPAFATPLPRATAPPVEAEGEGEETVWGTRVAVATPAPSPTPEVVKMPRRVVKAGPAPAPPSPSARPTRTANVFVLSNPTPTPRPTPTPKATPTPRVEMATRTKPTPSPAPPAAVAVAEAKEPARSVPSSTRTPVENRTGSYSLARQLGLTARRIVIDAGHGGHDPGSIGAGGYQEKDLTLDVALRLEKLVRTQLGAEVILTRSTDVFIPLEERTAIANQKGADLFLSIHANSSRNPKSRGIETYFLSFAQDPHAEAVAARENAISAATMKDLQNLVKAITLNSKIDESRDFAASVQDGMIDNIRRVDPNVPNRGVRTAPFYVLIGANMPSVLAEIAFVSHPPDEKVLRTENHRQLIAESLFDGLERYLNALNRTPGRQLTHAKSGSTVPSRSSRR